jgi:hypothetical protein
LCTLVSFNTRQSQESEHLLKHFATAVEQRLWVQQIRILNFIYKLENSFPQSTQLAEQFTLQNYNGFTKEMPCCKTNGIIIHVTRKTNLYRGITWNAMAWVGIKKVRTIRNEIQLDGINQFNTPILSNNPETNYNGGSFSKKYTVLTWGSILIWVGLLISKR